MPSTTAPAIPTSRLFPNSRAAEFLTRHLKDGRNYTFLLNDQRRGRRACVIPFKYRGNQVFYFEVDLLEFIDAERKRDLKNKPEFVEAEDDRDCFVELH